MPRKLNVERMRRYRAISEPNMKIVITSHSDLIEMGESDIARQVLFGAWMDKMMIKHKGRQDGKFEFMIEDLLLTNEVRIIGRVRFPPSKENQ